MERRCARAGGAGDGPAQLPGDGRDVRRHGRPCPPGRRSRHRLGGPDDARAAPHPGECRLRRGRGRGPAVRQPDVVWRAGAGAVRHHPRPRAPAPGSPGGEDGRRGGADRFRPHPAGAGAGHPPGAGHVERLHQPDAHRRGLRPPPRLARSLGLAGWATGGARARYLAGRLESSPGSGWPTAAGSCASSP